MKSLKTVFFLSASIFIFSACDELITKNIDVPIKFNVIQNIKVDGGTDPNESTKFITAGEYDILTHPDIADVIGTPDKIKKIKITEIVYEFYNFTGNLETILSGDFVFATNPYVPGDLNYKPKGLAYFDIQPVNVAEAWILREQFKLEGDYEGLNEYFTKKTFLHYGIEGYSSHNPAKFDIVLTVSATVTVEASLDFEGNFK